MNRREFMAGMAALAAASSHGRGSTCCARSGKPAADAPAIQPTRFKPIEISGLAPRPDFWKVRPQEIMDLCARASKCSHKEIIAHTPLGYPVYALFYGYPVYALFYGDFNDAPPQTNWSAGSSSTTWKNYMGNPPPAKQTFLFVAGIHGAEPECVAGAMNLIQLLETGADFRGRTYPGLADLIAKYRFIVVPCANMDGRAISPDHLHGLAWQDFRAASQGTWKDGSLIGWRGSKSWFPLRRLQHHARRRAGPHPHGGGARPPAARGTLARGRHPERPLLRVRPYNPHAGRNRRSGQGGARERDFGPH